MRNLALGLILILVLLNSALAAPPRTLSYQGALTDDAGGAVPDGPYPITFRLWDAPTGGLELWQETDTVTVAGGMFNATLGNNSALALDFGDPYWLGISIEGASELAPRVELAASPYAMHSTVADSLAGGMPGDLSCQVWASAATGVIPNDTNTALAFSSTVWDHGDYFDPGSPTRLTAAHSGTYLITGYINWDQNAAGRRALNIRSGGSAWWCTDMVPAHLDVRQTTSMIVTLAAGDYVELVVYQDSGASRGIDGARLAIALLGR